MFAVLSFDKRRLQQVLLNILSNAAKFSKKNGIIYVNTNIILQFDTQGKMNYLLEVTV